MINRLLKDANIPLSRIYFKKLSVRISMALVSIESHEADCSLYEFKSVFWESDVGCLFVQVMLFR